MKQHQHGRGGRLQGAEAEGQGAAEPEGGGQGGETSDKSIEMPNADIMLI